MDGKQVSRVKSAELISVLGAGFLGAGLALFWREKLGTFAVPILASGLVAHALGMYLKHQWERSTMPLPRWVVALYWVCWAVLAGLVIYILVS
jgi:hypothetical protein